MSTTYSYLNLTYIVSIDTIYTSKLTKAKDEQGFWIL